MDFHPGIHVADIRRILNSQHYHFLKSFTRTFKQKVVTFTG